MRHAASVIRQALQYVYLCRAGAVLQTSSLLGQAL